MKTNIRFNFAASVLTVWIQQTGHQVEVMD